MFLVPAAVIGAGVLVTRGKRRKSPSRGQQRACRAARGRGRRCSVTGRGVAVQGGLATLGLLAAYLTWQREPERAPGAVTVIDASKSDVTLIRYEDDSNAVDLTRQGKDVWLHLVVKKAAEPKPDPHGKADAKPPAPQPPPPPRDLPGGEGAKKLYDQFAPLTSPRAFGVLEPRS